MTRKVQSFNMASMKYKHCSNEFETTCEITKYLLISKVLQKTIHCTILCNILHKINDFAIAKTKTILFLAKSINKEKSLYTDVFDKRNPASIDKKLLNRNKSTKNI